MAPLRFRIYNTVLKRMLTDDEAKLGCAFMDGGLYPAANCIIMQSTGLPSKSGKEIFEGDIVRDELHGVGAVEWLKYCTDNAESEDIMGWCFKTPERAHALDPQVTYEVIGNIYENPELLPPQ